MKRPLLALLLLLALAYGAAAQDKDMPSRDSLSQELTAALADMASTQLGTLTIADMEKIAGRLSIAEQRYHYVRGVERISFHFPGAGQFMTGDPLGGSLYLAGNIAVIGGTLIGAYYLLPSDLRFSSSFNYFTSSYSQITTAWASHSFVDYLPSAAMLAGGFIVRAVLGHFSAVDAGRRARQNIADGKITFTPNFDFRDEGFWMGMRMRY